MMQRNQLLCGAAALVAIAGCGSGSSGSYTAQPVKKIDEAKFSPGQEANLFPWKVGNQWTFVLETHRQSAEGQGSDPARELTYKVVSVTPTGAGTKAKFEVSEAGKVADVQTWEQNAKGLFQLTLSAENMAFDPPQPAVMFPMDTGQTFKWSGTGMVPGNKKGTSKVESRVVGPQEVDTEMGRMSAIAVESQTQWTSGEIKGITNSVAWWTPGYGIVRFKQTAIANNVAITQLLKLKSATLK